MSTDIASISKLNGSNPCDVCTETPLLPAHWRIEYHTKTADRVFFHLCTLHARRMLKQRKEWEDLLREWVRD